AAGSYSVIVYLYSGTVVKDSTIITNIIINDSNEPCQIVVYNGVTPNGDGANDFFYIENIEQFPGNKVYIYNRWGLKLDEISNYDNLSNYWKGTIKHNGDVAPSGTYFYVIDLNNGTKPIKGWLELTHR
ncbi:MAG: gliding motility-associated C-terminal domain-containing protein, partial [Bacteroidia bacterium]